VVKVEVLSRSAFNASTAVAFPKLCSASEGMTRVRSGSWSAEPISSTSRSNALSRCLQTIRVPSETCQASTIWKAPLSTQTPDRTFSYTLTSSAGHTLVCSVRGWSGEFDRFFSRPRRAPRTPSNTKEARRDGLPDQPEYDLVRAVL